MICQPSNQSEQTLMSVVHLSNSRIPFKIMSFGMDCSNSRWMSGQSGDISKESARIGIHSCHPMENSLLSVNHSVLFMIPRNCSEIWRVTSLHDLNRGANRFQSNTRIIDGQICYWTLNSVYIFRLVANQLWSLFAEDNHGLQDSVSLKRPDFDKRWKDIDLSSRTIDLKSWMIVDGGLKKFDSICNSSLSKVEFSHRGWPSPFTSQSGTSMIV
jgi:hypothetical protein